LAEAFAFAYELHGGQRRKGSDVPYVTHLMAVAALVGEYGGNEDQMVAALLHDAAEDQGGETALERIRERFGTVVADYVAGCSDTFSAPKPPWRERKEQFLRGLESASPDLRLIIAADKLHNVRSILRDLNACGNGVWDRFTGGRDGTLWYHAEAVRALAEGWSAPIVMELADAVDALHRKAEALRE
jgi:GTP pyrophosphokinase